MPGIIKCVDDANELTGDTFKYNYRFEINHKPRNRYGHISEIIKKHTHKPYLEDWDGRVDEHSEDIWVANHAK